MGKKNMASGGDPYNDEEISRARTLLLDQMEIGRMQYLKRRLVVGETFPNLWEGEEGMMEHIMCPFPMPDVEMENDPVESSEGSGCGSERKAHVHSGGDARVQVSNSQSSGGSVEGLSSTRDSLCSSDQQESGTGSSSSTAPAQSVSKSRTGTVTSLAENKQISSELLSATDHFLASISSASNNSGIDKDSKVSSEGASSASEEVTISSCTSDSGAVSRPALESGCDAVMQSTPGDEVESPQSPNDLSVEEEAVSIEELLFWQKVSSLYFELLEIKESVEKSDIEAIKTEGALLKAFRILKKTRFKLNVLEKQFKCDQQERMQHGYNIKMPKLLKVKEQDANQHCWNIYDITRCFNRIRSLLKKKRSAVTKARKQLKLVSGEGSSGQSSSPCSESYVSGISESLSDSGQNIGGVPSHKHEQEMSRQESKYWKSLEEILLQLRRFSSKFGKLQFRKGKKYVLKGSRLAVVGKLKRQITVLEGNLKAKQQEGSQMGYRISRKRPKHQSKREKRQFVADLKQVNEYFVIVNERFQAVMKQIENVPEINVSV
ncbi:uncharacterized protein LOC101863619 isoform X2 [Aplysia californica]|nr:uncharacterized protein LOC101863619 isoform X2 [Aplysia californica]